MVLSRIVIGLSIAFLQWAYVFLLGFAVMQCRRRLGADESAKEPPDLLVSSMVGVATQVAVLFTIASCHLLFPLQIYAALAVTLSAVTLIAIRRISGEQFLCDIRTSWKSAANPVWIVAILVSIVLSAPAILPYDAFDSTMYHYAYAVDWSNAGSLTLDPFLRFPLAQFNVELIYSMFFALHLSDYIQFENWLFFAMTASSVATLARELLKKHGGGDITSNLGALITSGLFIGCPAVLRWMDVGLVDIPAGCMLFGFTVSAIKARNNFDQYGTAMALIGGTFIGTKFGFVPSFLLFAVLIVSCGRNDSASRKSIVGTLLLLLIIASPWFVRNLLISGDPIDPVVNLALRHSDPFWTSLDLEGQKADLNRDIPFLFIPVWFYLNPWLTDGAFSLSICFLYASFVALTVCLASRTFRSAAPEYFIITVIICFSILQELIVSNRVGRYALSFYGLYLVFLTASSWLIFRWISSRVKIFSPSLAKFVSLATLTILALPPPLQISEYNNIRDQFEKLDIGVREPDYFLSHITGYQEARDLANLVAASKTNATVLNVHNEDLAYFFRRKGVTDIGDWWGRGRYSDLFNAIDNSNVPAYVKDFDVGAVMFMKNDPVLSETRQAKFMSALLADGFADISETESDARAFARSDVLKRAVANEAYLSPTVGGKLLDFEDHFSSGTIGRASRGPEDRTAFIFPVLDNHQAVNAMSLVSGNTISFAGIHSHRDSVLSFDAAKIFSIGTPAIGSVYLVEGLAKQQLFSKTLPVASGSEQIWTHVRLPIGVLRSDQSLVFSASSLPGGGIADWIAFAHPQLSDATLDSGKGEATPTHPIFHTRTIAAAKVHLRGAATNSQGDSALSKRSVLPYPKLLGTGESSRPTAKLLFDFVREFRRGVLSDERSVGSPNGKAALVLSVGRDEPIKTLSLVAPIAYTYSDIKIPSNANLDVMVTDPFSMGAGAHAWVVIQGREGAPKTVVDTEVVPTSSKSTNWQHFQVRLDKFAGKTVSISFNSDSRGPDGTAAWASFQARLFVDTAKTERTLK